MRLRFTRLAERDLREIADYVAADDPRRAPTFVRELHKHCSAFASNPRAWTARPELGRGIRSSPHDRCVIFFSEEGGAVRIVRVLHSARDVAARFARARG